MFFRYSDFDIDTIFKSPLLDEYLVKEEAKANLQKQLNTVKLAALQNSINKKSNMKQN